MRSSMIEMGCSPLASAASLVKTSLGVASVQDLATMVLGPAGVSSTEPENFVSEVYDARTIPETPCRKIVMLGHASWESVS